MNSEEKFWTIIICLFVISVVTVIISCVHMNFQYDINMVNLGMEQKYIPPPTDREGCEIIWVKHTPEQLENKP
jgi:hypothetical protein